MTQRPHLGVILPLTFWPCHHLRPPFLSTIFFDTVGLGGSDIGVGVSSSSMLYDDVAMADFVFGICTTSSLSIIVSSSIFVRVYFPLAAASNPPSRFPLTIQLTTVSLLVRFFTSLVIRLHRGLSSLHKATNILKNHIFSSVLALEVEERSATDVVAICMRLGHAPSMKKSSNVDGGGENLGAWEVEVRRQDGGSDVGHTSVDGLVEEGGTVGDVGRELAQNKPDEEETNPRLSSPLDQQAGAQMIDLVIVGYSGSYAKLRVPASGLRVA
ncbi:hypothetical protein GALMADRAFT_148706 [Galerina marginata CBS 339.88]|uniref:Uncharacterized protein n=1 Tax=Galerina marginata (strain CBS 339.88) TaxID=685588 RepID=A0A067S6E3_GALM3|nr:hypothetical protein GALMADRAFT_148706 [Galerina marginata CBS 339.88]